MRMAPSHYRLLDLHIDIARQRVCRDDVTLDVQGLSFQLLACLLRHGVDVVRFDTLMSEVWAPAVVNEETVTQRIKLLRQSLGDDGRRPRYIRSVRGLGYQLCEPPEVLDETPAPGAPATRRHRRSAQMLAAMVGALALGGTGWWWQHSRQATAPPLSTTQALLQRAAYYAGIGQRDNNEHAIMLYQQALLASPGNAAARIGLSRACSARVCLYNDAYAWTDSAQQLAETVLKDNERNAAAWSALAYAHDCRGEMQDAIHAYERAVALDPADDASRASAAYLYQERGQLVEALHANLDMHGDPARVRFREVQIARELDLLGFTDAAEQRFRRSFELNPDNVFSNIAWPQHLFLQGRFTEAQAALEQAMTRNTPHVELQLLAGELALLRGDRAAAQQAFSRATQLRPQMSLPATLNALYGDTAPTPAWLDERIATMAQQMAAGVGYPSDRLELAMLQMARGRRAEALATIQAAVDAGYSDRIYLQISPLLRPLAGEPAYAEAVDAISRRVARQHNEVLAADWRPTDLRELH